MARGIFSYSERGIDLFFGPVAFRRFFSGARTPTSHLPKNEFRQLGADDMRIAGLVAIVASENKFRIDFSDAPNVHVTVRIAC